VLGEQAGARADVEHLLPRLYGELLDQLLARAKLAIDARLLVVLRELRGVERQAESCHVGLLRFAGSLPLDCLSYKT
jgi:hypothetical protein